MKEIRCPKCSKKLCEAIGSAKLKVVCNRCKTPYTYPDTSHQDKLSNGLIKK
jgi:phage FluMu protein Com